MTEITIATVIRADGGARVFAAPGKGPCAGCFQPETPTFNALNKLQIKYKLMLTHCNASAKIFVPQMPPPAKCRPGRGGRPPSSPFPPSLHPCLLGESNFSREEGVLHPYTWWLDELSIYEHARFIKFYHSLLYLG